ncbi:uncharacterized protein LOC144369840 isoform X2 [Ictidomys tridecemlineatus]
MVCEEKSNAILTFVPLQGWPGSCHVNQRREDLTQPPSLGHLEPIMIQNHKHLHFPFRERPEPLKLSYLHKSILVSIYGCGADVMESWTGQQPLELSGASYWLSGRSFVELGGLQKAANLGQLCCYPVLIAQWKVQQNYQHIKKETLSGQKQKILEDSPDIPISALYQLS